MPGFSYITRDNLTISENDLNILRRPYFSLIRVEDADA